uniref:Uncharacterized protein n=1 Tax=White spot syndrome virus TaxID=342409 RepID=A0A6B9MQB1_9VIRU|nr:hypothetical protein [White spot syndrome virus]
MRRSTTERELIAVPDIWVGQNPETFQLISGLERGTISYNWYIISGIISGTFVQSDIGSTQRSTLRT